MSSIPLAKSSIMTKGRSKIPMSYPKQETVPSSQVENQMRSKTRSTPNANAPTNAKARESTIASLNRRIFEKKYSKLEKICSEAKGEIALKQKQVDKLYKEVAELREKLVTSGGEDLPDLKRMTFSIIPCKNNENQKVSGNLPDIEKAELLVKSLQPKLEECPNQLLNLYYKSVEEKARIINELFDFFKEPKEQESVLKKLDSLKQNDDLQSLSVEEIKAAHALSIAQTVGEINQILLDLKALNTVSADNLSSEVAKKLEEASEELSLERKKSTALAEKKTSLENQLTESKAKIKKLEEQVSKHEARMQQYLKKETSFDQRMTVLKANMEMMKESNETRLKEMKKNNDLKEKEFLDLKKESVMQVEQITAKLEKEKIIRKTLEDSLAELQEKYKLLEEKSKNLLKLTAELPNVTYEPGNEPTKNEVALYSELKNIRQENAELKNQIQSLKEEKQNYEEFFNNKIQSDENLNDALFIQTAQTKSVTHKLDNLQRDYEKVLSEKNVLEKQVLELQNRMIVNADERERDKLRLEVTQLQQCTQDMQSMLTELRERNKELEDSLTQQHLIVETKEREITQYKQIMKNKYDVFNLMKPVDTVSVNNEDVKINFENINKQFREYNESLNQKLHKIESMKKTIKILKDQETKFQRTRTTLESRIASLESENRQMCSQTPRRKLFGIW